MLKNFFAAFSLKPFFMIKRMILTPRTKIFSRRFRLENRSGLPQRVSLPLDFFINKCRHDINKLNFNRNTKFSNLSSEERVALKNLSKRKDIIVKAADKGGALLVVWRAALCQKEALRQLSDTSFYAKVDKDLTSTNQQIVKSTINDLIVKQELPATATISSSQLLELHVFTFYLNFTNLTTQAGLLSLRVVALPNSFLANECCAA